MEKDTIIGDYFPENDKIIRMGNEKKEVVADAFVAYYTLNNSFKGYIPQVNERKHFKESLSDTDFLNHLGKKKIKKIKIMFVVFLIIFKIKRFCGFK